MSCILLVAGTFAAVAQSSTITINNNTNCAYIVTGINEPDGCGSPCPTSVCVLPNSTATLTPCNSDWYWDRAVIRPAIDACQACGGTNVVIGSIAPTNCTPAPNTAGGSHCAGCAPYTATFTNLTTIDIN